MAKLKVKVEEMSNGLIPVKYDNCEVFYDTKTSNYIAVIKMDTKRMVFQPVKE
ncbi:MAG: hypothetical protein IMZ52_01080 [Actinobacteria bacterium]|nr:hypothetical protein [Actinomycetota bacterium]MBE3114731.1 hypothetical protein [Actinomycetota bacterium]